MLVLVILAMETTQNEHNIVKHSHGNIPSWMIQHRFNERDDNNHLFWILLTPYTQMTNKLDYCVIKNLDNSQLIKRTASSDKTCIQHKLIKKLLLTCKYFSK